MLFGLTITESVETNLGSKAGTMIRFREVCDCGYDANGDNKLGITFQFFESRAEYLAKSAPLKVISENKRVEIVVPYGTEITETIIHQYIKTPLATIYTLADENS